MDIVFKYENCFSSSSAKNSEGLFFSINNKVVEVKKYAMKKLV